MLKARCPELNELPDTDPDNPLNFEKWHPADIEEPDKIKALKASWRMYQEDFFFSFFCFFCSFPNSGRM